MSFSVDFTSSKYDNIILICLKGRFGMQNIIIIDDMKEHIQYIQDIINTMNHQFQILTFLDIHDVLLHMNQFPDHSIIIIDIGSDAKPIINNVLIGITFISINKIKFIDSNIPL